VTGRASEPEPRPEHGPELGSKPGPVLGSEHGPELGSKHGPEFEIRPIAEGDSLAELTGLLHRAYGRLAESGLRFVASHQSEEVTAKRAARGECSVAVLGGEIVGTITLNPPGRVQGPAYYQRPGVWVFGQFAVEPALQGRGIGSRLLASIEARARDMGALEIACDTAEGARQLIELYGRRGYRPVGAFDWPVTNYVSVVLAKRLATGPTMEEACRPT
jgi:GNAT superfamily N-acetyltransferase